MPSSPSAGAAKRLADYRPPEWLVPRADFRFVLDPARTLVHARLEVVRQGRHDRPLRLDAEDLELLSVHVDGKEAAGAIGDGALELAIAADRATVETVVAIDPSANSRLMGLYASGGNLCTQCEAEGFRRITPWPDRPDILSRFRVRLEADETRFPVLLANGNLLAFGPLPDGRHFAEWDDPFPKPSYLFALVAGRLEALRDRFITRSGRAVALAIWVEPGDVGRTRHAMESLKQAMAWDEQVYGREYDLDQFNIVAVHDFNFGAMENKGLNIFNAKYILADPETATDWDFDSVAAVVAHEYFHNWSGNRVTCRDWFQLCLKEGFTVFRDQSFSESLGAPAVRRIEQVRALRTGQFPEDAGPLAHAVRPDSYREISNFYTATVYNKGAEIIRMMARCMGPAAFRAATDDYFATNDGRAATVEDFLAAMGRHGLDQALFLRWYGEAGTPRLDATVAHDPQTATARVRIAQSNPKAGAGAPPLPVPLAFALFGSDGRKIAEHGALLVDREAEFRFDGIAEPPVLSLNRGFAAPVEVGPAASPADLALLAAHEDDSFARYDALQQLMLSALLASVASGSPSGHDDVIAAMSATLAGGADPALVAETILVPSEALIAEHVAAIDPEAIHAARQALRGALLAALEPQLSEILAGPPTAGHDRSAAATGLRRLQGVALALLMANDGAGAAERAFGRYRDAGSMTDRMAALVALAGSASPRRDDALADFLDRYRRFPEVVDKWFLVQAGSSRADTVATVDALLDHPLFDRRNPNRLRSLLLGFGNNSVRFHDREGRGYALLGAEVLAADRLNPQSAARLVQPLARWRRMAEPWQALMRAALERVAAAPDLSPDLAEVVANALGNK